MSFNRHIVRNFNANKTNRIRYDEDDFTCRIYRFDKTYEKHYTPTNNTVTVKNGKKTSFNGFDCYQSTNDKALEITLKYNAKEKSDNYRMELLYANIHKDATMGYTDISLKASATIKINGKTVKNSMVMQGTDVNFSRNYQYCSLNKGENTITYFLSANTVFIGLAIKKYEIWEAKRHNSKDDKLTMIKATVEHTKDFQINTMTCEFMYYHELDELLEPTDPNANRSGFVFDYRDEINLWIKGTDGKNRQVFGGYISTVECDSDLTKLSVQCADRMIDLDRRYCLSEIYMKGYNANDNMDYTGKVDYLKNYNTYSDSVAFLTQNCEILPQTNLKMGTPLVKRNERKLATYKKGAYTKLNTNSNMKTQVNNGSITLRNGANTLKNEWVVIYDDSVAKQTVSLNNYPNLYFHYGLGDEKWEEKIEETSTVTVEGSTKASSTWINRANKITSATGNNAIKPIWKWVATEVSYISKRNFYQSSSKTYSTKKGNCCCKTELMLDLLNAKGVSNLQYVHCKSGSKGHIFAKVNGFYVDPSTSNEAKGWHNHLTGYGNIVKVSNYPNKPF